MGRKILTWAAILAGEALLIAAFILWGKFEQNVLILNIVVTSIVYLLFTFDLLFPWINRKERTQKRIGSLGIWWSSVFIYSIAALVVVFGFSSGWSFALSAIIQGALLLLLIFGLIASMGSADTVADVCIEQEIQRAGIDAMKRAVRKLQTKVDCCTEPISPDHRGRIAELGENLRYISPSNSPEASEIENEFIEVVSRIALRFEEYSLNQETIERELREAESIYKNRKNIYSN